jgi:hypothetical protein
VPDTEPSYEPPARDEHVVYWLDTARARLAEAAERARRTAQNNAKETDR